MKHPRPAISEQKARLLRVRSLFFKLLKDPNYQNSELSQYLDDKIIETQTEISNVEKMLSTMESLLVEHLPDEILQPYQQPTFTDN